MCAMSPRLLRPVASGFNPKSISGLSLWLDATDGATLFQNSDGTTLATATNDPVGYWGDKSGNGRHATQATSGDRPARQTLGGKPAVRFDGTSDFLSMGDLSAAFPSEATAFYVVSQSSGANAGSYAAAQTRDNDGWWKFAGGNAFLGVFRNTRLGSTAINLESLTVNSVAVVSSSSKYDVWQAGGKVLAGSSFSYAGGTNHQLGVMRGSTTVFFQGSLGEVIYYNRALSDAEVLRVYKYFASKWGLTLAPQVSNADAQDWVNRVYANGGTVSASTASAVNTFCNDIDAAGIRGRFYRLNLFCGTGLNACLVPLYRGPSRTGTQYGNTTDTNVGPFVSGDYTETGATGGLTANGTSKYLNTGLKADVLSQTDRHLSVVMDTGSVGMTGRQMIGVDNFGGAGNAFWGLLVGTASFSSFLVRSQATAVNSANVNVTGDAHILVSGNGSATGYANGVLAVTGPAGAFTAPTLDVYVLGLNRNGAVGDYFNGRLNAYSIGAAVTAQQASDFYTAMNAFQTSLSRT